jgi:hypothetical protein
VAIEQQIVYNIAPSTIRTWLRQDKIPAECEKIRFGRQAVTGTVEVVDKPQNFEFLCQKVLCFQ